MCAGKYTGRAARAVSTAGPAAVEGDPDGAGVVGAVVGGVVAVAVGSGSPVVALVAGSVGDASGPHMSAGTMRARAMTHAAASRPSVQRLAGLRPCTGALCALSRMLVNRYSG